MTDEENEPGAPGWEAIDAAVEPLYPGQEPRHWATTVPSILGGKDPLQGISAYSASGPLHWHFVTYGFSELYGKEWSHSEVSGFGFELTFRLRRDEGEEPPPWVCNFLQNLARYVFSTRCGFDSGNLMDLRGPIALDVETEIRGIAFIEDPELPTIATPNGRLRFLQVVGLTGDELSASKSWSASKFLELIAAHDPKSITDLDRGSLLELPAVAEAVKTGIEVDGSSTAFMFVSALSWRQERRILRSRKTVLFLGTKAIQDLGPLLLGRLPHERSLGLIGPQSQLLFEPGSGFGVAVEEGGDEPIMKIFVTPEHARELAAALRPIRGSYSIPALPNLEIVVEPSAIDSPDSDEWEVVG